MRFDPPLVPITRTLPALLRRELDTLRRDRVRLIVATVSNVPDAGHVTITYAGQTAVVPRLAGYSSPTVGQAVYCLAAGSMLVALDEAAP